MSVTPQIGQLPDWMFMQPPLISGRFYTAPWWASGISTVAVQAGGAYIVPFFNPRPVTWATIAIEVTANVASSLCRLGYFDVDRNGMPNNLKKDFGTVATTSNAALSITINEVVSQGLFWLMAAFDSAVTVRTVTGSKAAWLPTQGIGGSTSGVVCYRMTSASDWVTAMPYSFWALEGASSFTQQTAAPRILLGI